MQWTEYQGTGCSVFYSAIGAVLSVQASAQNIAGGNTNANIIGALPGNISLTGLVSGVPIGLLSSVWVPFGYTGQLSIEAGFGKNLIIRIPTAESISSGVAIGTYFIPRSKVGRQ